MSQGEHFFAKYAGVVRTSSARTIMAYSAQFDLMLTVGDVPTAYLNANIHDVIILSEQPPCFDVKGPNGEPPGDMVLRWNKALYGWVCAANEWGEEIREWLVGYGFVECPADAKCFALVRFDGDTPIVLIIGLHVDDLLMACSFEPLRAKFLAECPYKIKDLGPAKRLLGGDVDQDLHAGTV
eukprot:6045249-Prymnesium_polylepis.1